MTPTAKHSLTDVECDQIQMDVFGQINVNEREYQHTNKLIRAAYAAGAAAAPREPTEHMQWAGAAVILDGEKRRAIAHCADIWRAMYDAAPARQAQSSEVGNEKSATQQPEMSKPQMAEMDPKEGTILLDKTDAKRSRQAGENDPVKDAIGVTAPDHTPAPDHGFHLTMNEGLRRFTYHAPLTASRFDAVVRVIYDQSGEVASATREDADTTACSPAHRDGVTCATSPDPTPAPDAEPTRHPCGHLIVSDRCLVCATPAPDDLVERLRNDDRLLVALGKNDLVKNAPLAQMVVLSAAANSAKAAARITSDGERIAELERDRNQWQDIYVTALDAARDYAGVKSDDTVIEALQILVDMRLSAESRLAEATKVIAELVACKRAAGPSVGAEVLTAGYRWTDAWQAAREWMERAK